ncbi:MAG: hypothetical protein GVY14_07995 [Spirochaetes bacterium]|jgi:deoxyribose-phosphate aldolase|nr:hypothetical protein [Spirochaetota bacterium]
MSIYGVIDPHVLAGIVDSAAVGMDITDEKLREYLERFKKYPETSVVVVNFYQARLAAEICAGSHVEVCIAIAYPPLCAVPTELKVQQARYAVEELGVKHVLFTIDHSRFREGLYDEVEAEVRAVVDVVGGRAEVIVMPDFTHWNEEDAARVSQIIAGAGGDMIKSTGGMGRREDPKKVAAAVKAVDGSIKVMGTSAIRNLDETLAMMDAKPDKIAISRAGFFTTLDEISMLETVRLSREDVARRLSGLIWHPTTTTQEVKEYLRAAADARLYGVSVDPRWLPLAASELHGSKTKTITRVDTPFGITPTDMKVEELAWVVKNGAADTEIQIAMNTAAFKSGNYTYVTEELDRLVEAADAHPISVILQTPLLSKEETVAAVMLCRAAGVAAVEPIHGFGKFTEDGTVIHPDPLRKSDIELLSQAAAGKLAVRATGGIQRLMQALTMIGSGAERLVLPNAVDILRQYDSLVERVSPYARS